MQMWWENRAWKEGFENKCESLTLKDKKVQNVDVINEWFQWGCVLQWDWWIQMSLAVGSFAVL